MVYNIQNYCVFGFCPSSGILGTRNNNCLRLALSKGPNKVGVFPPHLRTETDPVSETLRFPLSRILDNG
jgi:hypothetical protein